MTFHNCSKFKGKVGLFALLLTGVAELSSAQSSLPNGNSMTQSESQGSVVLADDSRGASSYRRNSREYNLVNGLGLKGYDPVSYFRKPVGNFKMGQPAFAVDIQGVRYLTSLPSSKNLMLKDPNRFEPTYGGWCAWAMSNGFKVDIDVTQFSIYGRRLHFFANASAKARFDADYKARTVLADQNWNKFSGELPRK